MKRSKANPRVIAAMDIGTNSIRLVVARVELDHELTVLTQQREMVRLGENEFATNRLSPAAIERGVLVCSRFADVARGFGAQEISAFATSAVREANNQDEFIERARRDADLDVRVISGPEEARLIYLGVASGASLSDQRALFIDIGGGSTELVVGDAQKYHALDSLKLGAIRMANRFLQNGDPVSQPRYKKMTNHVRAVSNQTTRRFVKEGFDTVIGSAGTIMSLANITARRLGETPTTLRNYCIRVSDLRDTVDMLCRLPIGERRNVPGLDVGRADIIPGGAAVLMAILEDVGATSLLISDRGLRDGMLIDMLMREEGARATIESRPVRLRSVLRLCRTCKFDEPHALHIQRLAFSLFDELGKLGLHDYGDRERELLGYAALTHDIGSFLSHSGHERHAYYLVRHSSLLGFDDTEIAIIANASLYHRKQAPRKKHPNMDSLTRPVRRLIRVLSAILQVTEGLDRSHLSLVRKVALRRIRKPKRLQLTIESDSDCELEVWGVEQSRALFEKVFGLPLEVTV